MTSVFHAFLTLHCQQTSCWPFLWIGISVLYINYGQFLIIFNSTFLTPTLYCLYLLLVLCSMVVPLVGLLVWNLNFELCGCRWGARCTCYVCKFAVEAVWCCSIQAMMAPRPRPPSSSPKNAEQYLSWAYLNVSDCVTHIWPIPSTSGISGM